MTGEAPLIVTAALDDAAFDWFDALRRAHFPRHRNRVPAHLTLFHALPGQHARDVAQTLRSVCRSAAPMTLNVRGPWSLGRGVAYRLSSLELEILRADLTTAFAPWLTRQDQAAFRPHITVQNKVEQRQARALLEQLQHEFEPFQIRAESLLLWRYLGGPWSLVERFAFEG